MPAHEICYIDGDGALALTLYAICRDNLHAKILAHAMRPEACRCFEVWLDGELVYERPLQFDLSEALMAADAAIVVPPRTRLYSPAQQPFACGAP